MTATLAHTQQPDPAAHHGFLDAFGDAQRGRAFFEKGNDMKAQFLTEKEWLELQDADQQCNNCGEKLTDGGNSILGLFCSWDCREEWVRREE